MQGFGRAMFAAAALALCGTAAAKDETTIGISLEGSTLGAGLSVGMPLGDSFNVRGVYHGYTYELDDIEDDSGATYGGDLELKSMGLFADWHVFGGAFRLTAGFASNGNEIALSGMPTGGVFQVGDCTFESNPADPMRVDGAVEFASTAPYVGIGWGGNLNAEPGFFMTFDLGVLLSGSPEASLTGRGQARNANAGDLACGDPVTYQDLSSYPEFQQEVQDAEDEVNKETEDYELWPNIAIGIGWRF
jgi:hypothetical protein